MRRLTPVLLCAALAAGGPPRSVPPQAAWSGPFAADTMWVELGPGGSRGGAFVVWPAGQGPAPAILVLHGSWGLDGHIRAVARRLSRQGYVVVVPDLGRSHPASDSGRAPDPGDVHEAEDALATVAEAGHWLLGQPRTAETRIGVVGFSGGGTLAQRYATHVSDLGAVVVFYGEPETDPDALGALVAPLQGHFGAEDDEIPLGKVEALRSALAGAGGSVEIHIYPGAGHSFLREGHDAYRPAAARQAWARTLAFLQQRLKGR